MRDEERADRNIQLNPRVAVCVFTFIAVVAVWSGRASECGAVYRTLDLCANFCSSRIQSNNNEPLCLAMRKTTSID